MIIAVDYDGTLQVDGKPNRRLYRNLINAQASGNTIILWTCREGIKLTEAVRKMAQNGLRPNYVNNNAVEIVAKLGYNPRKVIADVYIDDKAVNP